MADKRYNRLLVRKGKYKITRFSRKDGVKESSVLAQHLSQGEVVEFIREELEKFFMEHTDTEELSLKQNNYAIEAVCYEVAQKEFPQTVNMNGYFLYIEEE